MNVFSLTYVAVDVQTGQAVYTFDCAHEEVLAADQPPGPGLIWVRADASFDRGLLHRQIWDGTQFFTAPERPSVHHRWNLETGCWQDSRSVDELRATRWEQIKRARDLAEHGGSTFEWDGSVFQSSPVRISGASAAARAALEAGLPFSRDWTLADNSVRTLSAVDMVQVGLAQGAHVDSLHRRARALRMALEQALTADEVEAVRW